MKAEYKGLIPIVGYALLFIACGVVLSRLGLAQPWSLTLKLQVWIGALIAGVLCFTIGKRWSDPFGLRKRQQVVLITFTQREKEVAEKMLQGKTNKDICNELFIEQNTLKTHIRNIYKKSGCSNRNEFTNLFTQTSLAGFSSGTR